MATDEANWLEAERPTPKERKWLEAIVVALDRGGYEHGDDITDADLKVIHAAMSWLQYEEVGRTVVDAVLDGSADLAVDDGELVVVLRPDARMGVWHIAKHKPL